MRLDKVTSVVPSVLFSYNLYNNSHEGKVRLEAWALLTLSLVPCELLIYANTVVCVVVTHGYCCSLLEVIDRSRSVTSVTKILQELEIKRVVGCVSLNKVRTDSLFPVACVIINCPKYFIFINNKGKLC